MGEVMIVLASQERYNILAEVDPATGKFELFTRPADKNLYTVHGYYSELDGHIFMLYRYDKLLYFRVDDEVFTLTDDIGIQLESRDQFNNRLIVKQNDRKVFEITYRRPVVDPPLSLDPTPLISEEDFDFGLLVFNVAKDPERKSRYFHNQ